MKEIKIEKGKADCSIFQPIYWSSIADKSAICMGIKMKVNAYLNFNGTCREAVNFYADVFETEKTKILTFGDMPSDPSYPIPEEAKRLVMHTQLNICGSTLMFSDTFPGMTYQVGNHISLAIVSDDKEKLTSIYSKLKDCGKIEMELQKTDWSECYGSLVDKYGIGWQINYCDH